MQTMSLGASALVALALIGLLFAVAAFVEGRAGRRGRSPRLRHLAYTLALAVYCSSWTIYGSVGSVVRDGWAYLPIYVAPILLLALAPRFLGRLSRAVAQEQATTVSDFIASRFGHDVVVARLVTVIALFGSVPYMALQFRSIGRALSITSGAAGAAVPVMVVAAVLLAGFAIMFGARRYELAGRSEGMVYAMGLDSLIKLGAMALVAAVAVAMLMHAPAGSVGLGMAALRSHFQPQHVSMDVGVIALISVLAVIALPRQFYMALVEARAPDDLVRARLGLAAYLVVMVAVVLPIALAGKALLGAKAPADYYVLLLPLAGGHPTVAVMALLGGISAASAMVITDATALATMVSNDLVFPSLMRGSSAGGALAAGALGQRMLVVRRLSIVAVIALALAWALLVNPRESLASLGLVAFAAMAQFTPHLLLAVRGRENDPTAARASLMVGLGLWLYTLALPPILPLDWLAALAGGAFDPLHLLGLGHASPLVHGVGWSLGANLAVYAAMAARKLERSPLPGLMPGFKGGQGQVSDLIELRDLAASFIGRERADEEFATARRGMAIDRRAAQRARRLIGSVVGASSARALVASALAGGQMSIGDVTRLLDERGHSLRFSQGLLAATFENIDAGISVVDSQLNLVAWNARYEALFAYPPGMLRVGAPVAELIRYNAERGDFGPGEVEHHVAKRLGHLRRGQEHGFERHRDDGRVIRTVGGPMPGGGYVTSYTDMTEEARVRAELERTAAELESRVMERTEALSTANRQLAIASRDKTRFLAAASHDLLQPLHAARLFTAALARQSSADAQALVGRVDSAIVAAEDLLRALLDISKFDAGGVQQAPELLDLAPFLTGLVDGFRPMAEAKGLGLRIGPLGGVVRTDAGLLRSIMQNFIANALRYTEQGGVLVGVRRRGDRLRIDVVDTGVGIDPAQLDAIFGEFTRLGTVESEGFGLGLALVERIARVLGARVSVKSEPGRGSRFSLSLAMAAGEVTQAVVLASGAARAEAGGLVVLVVDDDPRIVEASLALLASLGHRGIGACNYAAALGHGGLDAVLADYRLGPGEDGLSLIADLRAQCQGLAALLITAEDNAQIWARAGAMGIEVVAKPAPPESIAQFLAGVARRARLRAWHE